MISCILRPTKGKVRKWEAKEMWEGMSLSRWLGCIWEWHNCVGIFKTLIQITGWSITGVRHLTQSLTIRKGIKHCPGVFHVAQSVQNSCILQATKCGLHQEQHREPKAIYVLGFFCGSETDPKDPFYSILRGILWCGGGLVHLPLKSLEWTGLKNYHTKLLSYFLLFRLTSYKPGIAEKCILAM